MVWRAHAPAWHVESSGRKLANLEYSQASRRVSTRHARVRALRLLDAFYDAGAEIVVDRSNAPNRESGGVVQIVPLSFSSFTARDKSQHENIQKLRGRVFCVAHRRKHRVDADHPAVAPHALAAILEEPNALLILPVVNDVLHDVDVGRRYRLEHIFTDVFQAVGDRWVFHGSALARNWNEFREIEDGRS